MVRTTTTTEQLRGDIDHGLTGDKAPGSDPAAAPLGADEEAGGAGPTPVEATTARRAERRPGLASSRPNGVNPGITPDGHQTSRPPAGPLHWALVAILGAVLVVTASFAGNIAVSLFGLT